MFKIVHIITRFIRGGADENTLLSCNFQAQVGHEVHLVYGDEVHDDILGKLDARVRRWPIMSMGRAIDPVRDLAALVSIHRIVRSIRPDIVHTHTSKAGVLGRVAARWARVPIIVHGVHIAPFDNVPQPARLAYTTIERALAPVTHAFVNVSEGMREVCLSSGVGKPEQHEVVPSGMAIDRFKEASPYTPSQIAARTGFSESARLLVFAAALEPRKRQYEFLDVVAEVSSENPEVRLILVGEGHDRDRIAGRAEALGLSDKIHFAGFSHEVERWIAAADICVLASEREGLPRTAIQYVAAGRPVVMTRLPGIEAIVRDGENGFLVNVHHVKSMGAPILKILSDAELQKSMAASSASRDVSKWSVEYMCDQLERIYADLQA